VLGTRKNAKIIFGTHWEYNGNKKRGGCMPFANVARIIDRYDWEHIEEHMLKTWEHVGMPSGNPLLNYRQCDGNTLGIRGK
jgi:hypothetical protein